MTGSRWTPQQEQAMGLAGCHLLVSAGAGAGKTSVLVERIVRRVLDPRRPVDIDRFLVVTFTDAAAAEMKERIRNRLEEAAVDRPGDPRIRRQLALLGRASVSTLHAFCLRVIRQYFFHLDLDPQFKVTDPHEAQLLQHEVLDQFFEEHYTAGDAPFLELVESYGGRGDGSLRQLVLELYRTAYAQPWPQVWLDQLVDRYRAAAAGPVEASPWFTAARQALAYRLEEALWELERAVELCRQPGGPAAWEDVLADDVARWRDLLLRLPDLDWEGIRAGLMALGVWGRLPRLRADDPQSEALKEGVKACRQRAKDVAGELLSGLWGREAADVLADARRLLPRVEALVGLVRGFAARLEAAKRERGLVDFVDMERLALQVLQDPAAPPGRLQPSPVARQLRQEFAEVLVDEYQDINPLQDAILQLVARDGGPEGSPNLFLVGDVKQSIYRFRQAEPGLFLAKYRSFRPPAAPAAAGQAPGLRLELNANFRSRPTVVAAVNALFRRLLNPDLGGLAYDDDAALIPGAQYPPPPPELAGVAGEAPVEIHLLERAVPTGEGQDSQGDGPPEAGAGPGEPGDAGEATGEGGGGTHAEPEAGGADTTALEREAALVAWRIRQLVEGEPGRPPLHLWDREQGVYRPARYRDVVVLLRAVQHQAATFADILSRWGVPVYARTRGGYLAAVEVEILLALLRLIDNPRQDVPLAAVLRSPLVGLEADELARIRLAAPEADYYTALCRLAGWDPDGEEPAEPRAVPPEGAAGPGPAGAGAHSPESGGETPGGAPGGALGGSLDGPPGGAQGAGPGRSPADLGAPGGGGPSPPAQASQGEAPPDPSDPSCPDPSLVRRLRRFLADLRRWRTLARRAPLSQLIHRIYQETGIVTYVTGMPGGEQRRANLEALLERARQFDRFARQGLFRFLRFLDRLREREEDLGVAPALGEAEDVVRVMTIHQSKGLEFPVVVVANLGGAFRVPQGEALVDRDLGLGLKVADPVLRIRYPGLAYEAVRQQARLAGLAEELRILYVAMTRARERLILVGSARRLPAVAARWLAAAGRGEGPLPAAVLAAAGSYMDWLGPALIGHPSAEPLRRLAQGDAAWPLAGDGQPAGTSADGRQAAGRRPGAGAALAGAVTPSGSGATKGSPWSWWLWPSPPVAPEPPAPSPSPALPAAEAAEAWWESLARGEPLASGVDAAALERLRRTLAWRYPYAAVANLPAKRSVSELKDRPDPERLAYPLPAELRRQARWPRRLLALAAGSSAVSVASAGPDPDPGAGGVDGRSDTPGSSLSAAERGAATHRVLQHLDLGSPLDRAAIRRQVEDMVHRQLLTPPEAAAVDVDALVRFFQSDLGRRLRQAPDRVQREWMFTLGLPVDQVYPELAATVQGAAAGDVVVVQGVIDCFVEEEEGFLLLDFKTDQAGGRSWAELAERYRRQVQLYRRALEEIQGRPVREAYLYFLAAGLAVAVP